MSNSPAGKLLAVRCTNGVRSSLDDLDCDGDEDLLISTNSGRPQLLRYDQLAGIRSIRFRLTGTKFNRDGISAEVRVYYSGASKWRMVKSGSSYLSQSEQPVTFREKVNRRHFSPHQDGLAGRWQLRIPDEQFVRVLAEEFQVAAE